MRQSRISPGVFMSKDNKYLYAFCGEISTMEKYDVKHDFWSDVQIEKPEFYGTRYGIKTIALWNFPDPAIQSKFEDKVLVVGGEQNEVSLIDMADPNNIQVNFIDTKTNALKKLFQKIKNNKDANIMKLNNCGQFYEPYVFLDKSLIVLDRNEIHQIDLKKMSTTGYKFLGVKTF